MLASIRRSSESGRPYGDPKWVRRLAKKLDLDVNPVSGAAIDRLLAELYATPKDVLVKAGQASNK